MLTNHSSCPHRAKSQADVRTGARQREAEAEAEPKPFLHLLLLLLLLATSYVVTQKPQLQPLLKTLEGENP
jgi:hypothetical protein